MLRKTLIVVGLLLAVGMAQAAMPGMNGTATKPTISTVAKEQVQPAYYYRRYVVRRYVVPRRYYAPRRYVVRRHHYRHRRFLFGFY